MGKIFNSKNVCSRPLTLIEKVKVWISDEKEGFHPPLRYYWAHAKDRLKRLILFGEPSPYQELLEAFEQGNVNPVPGGLVQGSPLQIENFDVKMTQVVFKDSRNFKW